MVRVHFDLISAGALGELERAPGVADGHQGDPVRIGSNETIRSKLEQILSFGCFFDRDDVSLVAHFSFARDRSENFGTISQWHFQFLLVSIQTCPGTTERMRAIVF